MKKTTEQFIEEARRIHGDKYDYSKVEYISAHTKICVICPKHGEFWQMPYVHLNGNGCPSCGGVYRYNTNAFIEAASAIHNNKYDYSRVEYKNNKTKICIICPKHGEFWQTPHMHLQGQGCPKCAHEQNGLNKRQKVEDFIEKAKKIHGDKYDYSRIKYLGYESKICLVCPIHGEFFQTPHEHLSGCGCPKCKQSHMERKINQMLTTNNIKFQYNSRPSFLNGLEADFYLKNENVIIECQGLQHIIKNHFFEPIDKVFSRDKKKLKLCQEHNISIIYIFNKRHSKARLDEQFNHMYDDVLFIEDIEKNPKILLDKISEAKMN